MAWNLAQLKELEQAILEVSLGAQSYTINGRTVTKPNLEQMRALRTEMQRDLGQVQAIRPGRVNWGLG